MADIVLIRPTYNHPNEQCDFQMESRPPSGLLYIAAPLIAHGFDIAIIDQTVENNWKERLLKEINSNTLCVGITSLTGNMILNGIEIAKIVRELSSCPIVWGGPHPSLEATSTILSEFVDIIVQGEGEETFPELVFALRDHGALENIHGIVFKKDGQVFKNPPRRIYDLNNLPPLPLHLVNWERYRNNYVLKAFFNFKNPLAVSLETSRGCTHRCTYCVLANEEYNDLGRANWRGMSAEYLANMIEDIIKKHNISSFAFIDDNFFVDMCRVTAFLHEIELRSLKIEWFADVRLDSVAKKMDSHLLQRLEKAGLRSLGIGIESGSDRILKYLRKGAKVETYIKGNQMLAETSIVPQYGFIQGLPTETIEDAKQTYSLITRFINDNEHASPMLNKLLPTPGTPLLVECIKHGFKPPERFEDWASYCDTGWTREIAELWMDKECVEFIVRQIYYKYILAFCTPYAQQNYLKKLILSIGIKIISLRIKYNFFYFSLESMLFRIVLSPSLKPFFKKLRRLFA